MILESDEIARLMLWARFEATNSKFRKYMDRRPIRIELHQEERLVCQVFLANPRNFEDRQCIAKTEL